MPLFILIVGVVLTLVSYSGFGDSMHINDYLLFSAFGACAYYMKNRDDETGFSLGQYGIWIAIICGVMLCNVFLNYKSLSQLLNYTTLFGIAIGVSLLTRIRWDDVDFLKAGIAVWSLSTIIIWLFTPGNVLSGWNPNSAIGIIPCVICGLSLIYVSDNKYRLKIFYACLVLTSYIVLLLENRSSLIALIIYSIIAIPYAFQFANRRLWFRVFYIGVLLLNVGMPLFNEIIGQTDWYNDAVSVSQEYVNKDGGFSNRDYLWKIALYKLSSHPLLGYAGIRNVYYHNFSCDVLTQFGWLGWITFASMFCMVMEKCYSDKSRANIFLFGCGCLLVLNTFENAFLANGFFTVYPYLLFAIPWQLMSSDYSNSEE